MAHFAYYRVSTTNQSVQAQKAALAQAGVEFEREYTDEGISGAVLAANRPAFKKLLEYIRDGDTLHVYAVDRLGRDAIDVQSTIKTLLAMGVQVDVRGLGVIGKGVGELIVAVLAQVAEMERERIRERTATGRETAKASLAATGKTHRGKDSLGRPPRGDAAAVRAWRAENRASIRTTAEHFNLSDSTVKRYTAAAPT